MSIELTERDGAEPRFKQNATYHRISNMELKESKKKDDKNVQKKKKGHHENDDEIEQEKENL